MADSQVMVAPQAAGSGIAAELVAPGAADVAAPRRRSLLRRFASQRLAVLSLVVLVLLILTAFIGGAVWHYNYTDFTDDFSAPPSPAHPFGTDASGHDTFAQVLRGTQRSLLIAFVVAAVSTTVGTLVGALAGFYRGATDSVLMRLVDLLLTLPILAVAALLGHSVGDNAHGWFYLALVLALLLWAPIARVVRGVTLSLREKDFVDAARALGASNWWIIRRHVLPNAAGAIIVNAAICVALAILAETALSYVNFGVQAPDVSLGSLVYAGSSAAATRPWLFYFPGGALILLVLSVNLIGDGLRDALDPSTGRAR